MKFVPSSGKKTSGNTVGQEEPSSNVCVSAASSSRPKFAINTLDVTIQIIRQVTELVPIDVARNVLVGITSILVLLQKNVKNMDDLKGLVRRCDAICSTLAQATKDVSINDMSDVLGGAVEGLRSSIDELHFNVKKALQRGRICRFIGANLAERQINGWTVELDGVLTLFSVGSFVDRVASVLGLPSRGAEGKNQVIANLASSPVLIALDNAESFEDAENSEAAEQIESIVSDIANTRGVTVILTSRTSHNARDAHWTQVRIPPLEKVPARKYFREIYTGDITDDAVDKVLAALDFHPLSIHILAHTASESQWTGEELLEEWNTRLLQEGRRKENLGFTIRLSLSSPSVKNLGDKALDVLYASIGSTSQAFSPPSAIFRRSWTCYAGCHSYIVMARS
ncbi:hypothetical protein JVU11DRAFT_12090 [Chiua virens]|nr:hypothetical protein JVU11DRAFT_12090 [Chiua virens]